MTEREIHHLPRERAGSLAVTECPQGIGRVSEEEERERAAATKALELFNKRASIYDFLFRKMIDFAPVFHDFFYEHDLLASDMKVLDAGTGTGLLTRIMYPLAREKGLANIVFHAFDLTPAMLDVFNNWIRMEGAEEAISTRIQNVLHLDTLPETWNDYDLVVTVAMLEYIPRQSLHKAIGGLIGCLKPGGKMILFLSGRKPLMRLFLGWLWRSNLYTKCELDAVLAMAGATDVEYLPFPIGRPYLTRNGYMLVVQITRPVE